MSSKTYHHAIKLAALFVLSLAALACPRHAFALELGPPFTDGAVLQRELPVPVWGWAKPGAKVSVSFAGQTATTKAGKDGKWTATLNPLKANADPQEMTITESGGGASAKVKDILVGEVWVASGQSNMQWLASKCDVGQVLQKGISDRVSAGKEPAPIIREAQVTDVFSALHPIEHATVKWSSDKANMSGIAYAFAYDLWKELGIPIGILNCSFSSTAIEAWTPREGFKAGTDEYTKSVYARILQTDPTTAEHKAAWENFYAGIEASIQVNEQRVKQGKAAEGFSIKPPGNLQGNRDASWLYNARMHPVVPYAIRGAIWNQGYANSGAGLKYYPNLHSMVRGWRIAWDRPDLPVYFHQFYSAGKAGGTPPGVSFGSTSEMRLGTAMARDIPNTGMASQIDIGGSIHYNRKALPGQRLALHALKNQYGKDVVANGPFFKSYSVQGNKLTVSFEHTAGGLFVGQVETDTKLPAKINALSDADATVKLFYLADENHVWHPAKCKIVGQAIELTAKSVDRPRGVSYGTPGIGFQPNIYNKAKLPLTPFVVYDNEVVTKATWPHDPPKIAGVEPDPNAGGLVYEYRKMPILSTQFRDNAVLQHGVPLTIWGAAIHNWGRQHHDMVIGTRKAVIKFSFHGIEKTIPVTPEMTEWSVTLDPMKPSAEPKTLKVSLEVDGEVVHERTAQDIVIGEVWYVAAPSVKFELPQVEPVEGIVRVLKRKAKRDRFPRPSRYSIAVSTTPLNRFASEWVDDKSGLSWTIGQKIAAKTGNPVGIIFMQNAASKTQGNPPLKSWIPFHALADAPSLTDDYRKLGASYPGSPSYNDNLRRYAKDWQAYWNDYIPAMMDGCRVPDGVAWGTYPVLASKNDTSEATQSYNVMMHSFTPTTLGGAILFTSADQVSDAHYDEQVKVLKASWSERLGGNIQVNVIPEADGGALLEGIEKAIK